MELSRLGPDTHQDAGGGLMASLVIVSFGSYLFLYLLTGNLWISIAAGVICCLIWNFMSGDK